MTSARTGSVLATVALLAAGCGSSSHPPARATPTATAAGIPRATPVRRGEERVIRRWASELRHGHVARAARVFALPVLVSNATEPVELRTRRQAEAFNRSLPCGAVVVRFDGTTGGFVVATFKLVERPGAGSCGSGTGHLARTAFLVRHGHITRWIRVADPPQPEGSES